MARKTSTIATFDQLWHRHETLYRTIFIEALKLLEITDEQRKNEDAISEALCPSLQLVCFFHKSKPALPQWERPLCPVTNTDLKGGKVRKRPDFTCSLVNTFAQTPERHEISLHIECKRLGAKLGVWDLNRNYIENGVKRFDSHTHEYGKRAASGIMIGYIVNSEKNDILCAVNKHLSHLEIPDIAFVFMEKVESCEVAVNRRIVAPRDFGSSAESVGKLGCG